jgi:hypothetical protein
LHPLRLASAYIADLEGNIREEKDGTDIGYELKKENADKKVGHNLSF